MEPCGKAEYRLDPRSRYMDSKRQHFEKDEPQATMKSRRLFNADVDTFMCM